MDDSRATDTRLPLNTGLCKVVKTTRCCWAEGDNAELKQAGKSSEPRGSCTHPHVDSDKQVGRKRWQFCFFLSCFVSFSSFLSDITKKAFAFFFAAVTIAPSSVAENIIIISKKHPKGDNNTGKKRNLSQFPSCQIKEWADKSAVSGCW